MNRIKVIHADVALEDIVHGGLWLLPFACFLGCFYVRVALPAAAIACRPAHTRRVTLVFSWHLRRRLQHVSILWSQNSPAIVQPSSPSPVYRRRRHYFCPQLTQSLHTGKVQGRRPTVALFGPRYLQYGYKGKEIRD